MAVNEDSMLLTTEQLQAMLSARQEIGQIPDRICLDCKWSKHSQTSTPLATDVRCFNPKIVRLDPAYAVLGAAFNGVSCIQQRGLGGSSCGPAGLHYESATVAATESEVTSSSDGSNS